MMGSVSCTCLNCCTVIKKCLCKRIKKICSFSCHPGHSCTNSFSFVMDASKSPIINLQNYCCKAPQDDPTPWMEIEDVILYDAQRHILSSDMEWLNDKIILAAELLFKRKYPHISGLQSPSLAETMSFEPQPSSPFLQILCQNNNHWILVSTVGCPPKTEWTSIFKEQKSSCRHIKM